MMCCAPAACSASTIVPTFAANEVAVARIVAGMLAPPPIAVSAARASLPPPAMT